MTDDEKVQLQRAAFVDGWRQHNEASNCSNPCDALGGVRAARRYPLPRQPRVVTIDGRDYRLVDGTVEYRWKCRSPTRWEASVETPTKIRALAYLLDNPTAEPS